MNQETIENAGAAGRAAERTTPLSDFDKGYEAGWEAATLLHAATPDKPVAGLLREGIEAFRLTREYVDPTGGVLPALPGWSWFDWCEKAAARLREDVG